MHKGTSEEGAQLTGCDVIVAISTSHSADQSMLQSQLATLILKGLKHITTGVFFAHSIHAGMWSFLLLMADRE